MGVLVPSPQKTEEEEEEDKDGDKEDDDSDGYYIDAEQYTIWCREQIEIIRKRNSEQKLRQELQEIQDYYNKFGR